MELERNQSEGQSGLVNANHFETGARLGITW